MIEKTAEKEKAVGLRKKGFSYSEILKEIPVAKSTLSLWLRSVDLSKKQKQELTEKKLLAAHRGGEAKRKQRIVLTQKIQEQAIKEIKKITEKEFWLIGIMLYWAEGSKEKESRPGSGVQFINSDPEMIKLFLKWLKEISNTKEEDIIFDIYIHENSKNNIEKVKKYWSNITGFPLLCFTHIYYKKNKIKTNRKNTGNDYFGIIKIKVRKSSILCRKIAGWIKGVIKYAN